MLRYAFGRIAQVIPTLVGVSIIAFVAMRALGDPAHLVLGDMATSEAIAQYRKEQGLDQPPHIQYVKFVRNAVRGDLGYSYRYRTPVLSLLLEPLPATIQLGLAALGLATATGVPLGALAALRRGRRSDVVIRALALGGQAIPGFFLALLLIIIFAVQLRVLPTGGTGTWRHLVLPSVALGAVLMALIVRFTRSEMLDALGQDYMRTARSKGVPERVAIFRHAFRNVLIPLVTVIALQASVIFSGAVVTETIFGWPGVGRLAVEAVQGRDFPLMQATVLFISGVVVCINLCVDVSYAFLDPRVRYR
jgi:peptide/nickel transport system permease protein